MDLLLYLLQLSMGRSGALGLLLSAGGDHKIRLGSTGWSPLFVGAWNGHQDVVSALLKAGADVDSATTSGHLDVPAGSTPLSVAALRGHREVEVLLRAHGAK